MKTEITVADVREIQGEPRIEHTHLSRALGYQNQKNIREIIERHETELLTYGDLPREVRTTGKGGRPGTKYFLNERQAIFATMRSDGPLAAEARHQIINVFVAWTRGELLPVAVATKPLPTPEPVTFQPRDLSRYMIPALIRGLRGSFRFALDLLGDRIIQRLDAMDALARDRAAEIWIKDASVQKDIRRMHSDMLSALEKIETATSAPGKPTALTLALGGMIEVHGVVERAGFSGQIPQRGRLSGTVQRSLDAYCKHEGYTPRSASVHGRDVTYWPEVAVDGWLVDGGKRMIEEHVARNAKGPNVISIVPKSDDATK